MSITSLNYYHLNLFNRGEIDSNFCSPKWVLSRSPDQVTLANLQPGKHGTCVQTTLLPDAVIPAFAAHFMPNTQISSEDIIHPARVLDSKQTRELCKAIELAKTSFEKLHYLTSYPSEHLKRTHGPIELSDGISNAKADVLQSPPQPSADAEIERVTQEQLTLIANLPRNSNIEEKWDMIYKVIFPGEEDVKPAYMPTLERLRDHARNPPEWLITNLIAGGIGESRREVDIVLQNFLIFVDIIGGNSSSLPTSIIQPSPDGIPEMHVKSSLVDDVDDMNDKSEAGPGDLGEDDSSSYNDREKASLVHDSPTGKIITCSFK